MRTSELRFKLKVKKKGWTPFFPMSHVKKFDHWRLSRCKILVLAKFTFKWTTVLVSVPFFWVILIFSSFNSVSQSSCCGQNAEKGPLFDVEQQFHSHIGWMASLFNQLWFHSLCPNKFSYQCSDCSSLQNLLNQTPFQIQVPTCLASPLSS